MKTASLKKGKNAKEKFPRLLAAHYKIVHYNGESYLIKVAILGSNILADAENIRGRHPLINLFGKDDLAKELRALVEAGIYN